MVRRSQTEMAVLGALGMQPMTAYALREAIRDVLGHFWRESFGQIYPTLGALERGGYVRREPGARRGSSTFSLTSSGRARLRTLLEEPAADQPPRNGLLLRIFFGRSLGVAKVRQLLLDYRAECERRLAQYEALITQVSAEDAGSPDLPFQLITIAAGRHGAEAMVAWATEALAALPDESEPSR